MSSENGTGNARDKQLLQYWGVLRKRRRTIFGFTGVLVATVLAVSLVSTRYYQSGAIIEISPKAPVVLDVEKVTDTVPQMYGQMQAYYETQYKVLRSRSVMQEAFRRLREEHGFEDLDEHPDPAGHLRAITQVLPEFESHLVEIRVEYPDPETAALIANTIAQTYMDVNLSRSLETSQEALAWLKEQQGVYRDRKRGSDERVQAYRNAHGLVGPDDKNLTEETLARLQEAWGDAHTRRVTAEAIQGELSRISRNGGWLGLANHLQAENTVLQDMLGSYETLRQARAGGAARYKDEHPEMVLLDNEIRGVEEQIRARVDSIIAGQKAELQLVQKEEARLTKELEAFASTMEQLGADMIDLRMLTAEAERDELFFRSLDQRMTEVGLSQFLQANNIRFIDRARPSDDAVRPKVLLNLLSAVLVGLMGGASLALLMEFLDASVKSREDVEEAGVSFLGVVPMVDPATMQSLPDEIDRSIFVNAMPRSQVAECLRTIRTNLLFRSGRRPLRRLLVTSAAPREGKSFISSNLATIIAMTGQRVLMIDGDLRRPTLHKRFGLPNTVGLSHVLAEETSLPDAVQHTHVPGLSVLVAGPMPENPSELLGASRIEALLDGITGYDLILIDSPPVSVVSDALVLASLADGVVFVIEANQTRKALAAQCCERLAEVTPNLLGAIVNKLDVRRSGYDYSYYTEYEYYYRDDDEIGQRLTLG